MQINNIFYLRRLPELRVVSTGALSVTDKININGAKLIRIDKEALSQISGSLVVTFNFYKGATLLSQQTIDFSAHDALIEMPKRTDSLLAQFSNIASGYYKLFTLEKIATPHYTSLKKKYEKESNQIFFREELDGKITLFGYDYDFVKLSSLEDTLYLDLYQEGNLYATNTFNKTDCSFDYTRGSVELKLTANDKYTDILNKYDNTYDLIKLAPAITKLELTKRVLIQLYTAGSQVVTNFFSGAYWEEEVTEQVDNENELVNKYHFAKGDREYQEISLEGFNYGMLNTSFRVLPNGLIWNSNAPILAPDGSIYERASIVLSLTYAKGTTLSYSSYLRLLSSDYPGGFTQHQQGNTPYYILNYDFYRIKIYSEQNGGGLLLYQSEYLYANDNNMEVAQGTDRILMNSVSQSIPQQVPDPATFYLGANVINYDLYARVVYDTDIFTDGFDNKYEGYDIPLDDFAITRANLKRCIGLELTTSANSIFEIYHTDEYSTEPTSYGQNDYGTYFRIPTGNYYRELIPLARSDWGNTSLWLYPEDYDYSVVSFEAWCAKNYKTYTLKDSYSLADVIKAFLAKIAPTITHEATVEYSRFLYKPTSTPVSPGEPTLNGFQVYITPKSNILKGDYDQPAQKAELTFEQLMNMLRDCFRCYWFIDENNRFRIEHISYFMKGLSYAEATKQYDLKNILDKFNRKPILYDQQKISFDKSELASRYEFNWMDDVTEAMGDLQVDIKSEYVQKDKTETITVDMFTPDIDFMLMAPDKFSEDGFALILAKDGKTQITNTGTTLINPKQYNLPLMAYVQNYEASWKYLARYYTYDMPAAKVEYSGVSAETTALYHIRGVKRCMQHEIAYQYGQDPDLYQLIGTDIGNGFIESISADVDTRMLTVTLSYEPE